MFDAPIDAWYVWIGLAAASVTVAGVAVDLPPTTPPDASAAATTVDAVAGGAHPATAEYPVTADAVQFGPQFVALERDGERARAPLRYGPVTPVGEDERLERVLDGSAPHRIFESPAAFERAAENAREPGEWRTVDGSIRVRKVAWRGVNVTLVGA